MADVRVRFSPAPTGFLHVGGARTALFNWLYARGQGGTYFLRVEDTDVARSRQEWIDGIQSTLRWLHLDWDGDVVLQSTRFDRYLEAADELLATGHAYECFCTEEEVQARNEAAKREGRPPGYDGRCRDLTADERAAHLAAGKPRSIRFRTPDEGESRFDDLVRGEVAVEWATIHDFVIVRSNGTPVFFLANAVDDADMAITHVIRGEDLLDSTHRVLAIRKALSVEGRPQYAHLPLLVGEDRAKLSKRHGAVALEDFRDRGYLAAALVNYLALLGWSPPEGDDEIMTVDELVARFDLTRVTHSPAFFDYQKLDWLNGEHIRALPLADLVAAVLPFARDRYGDRLDIRVFEAAVALAQERATTLVQIADQAEFLFVADDQLEIAEESWARLVATERVDELLDAVAAHLRTCEWTLEAIDLRPVLEPLGFKPRKALPAIYTAVEGHHSGLPLFDAIFLLGRDSVLARLAAAREAGRRVKKAFRIALRVAGILVVCLAIYLIVTFVQVWRAGHDDRARASDAIVVLGAAQYDGVPSPVLKARLDHAVELYEDDVAPVIVVTGGRQEGDRYTEATAAATYLHSRGVPDDAIMRETTGKSSWESLAASARFLDDQGMTRVVLVSDPYHAMRIDLIASEVGLDAVTSPTRTSPITGVAELRRYATETLRVAAGRVFGFGRLDRNREDLPEIGALALPVAMLGGLLGRSPGSRQTL